MTSGCYNRIVNDLIPFLYEQSIDYVVCALDVSVVYTPVFEKFPLCLLAMMGEPIKLDS